VGTIAVKFNYQAYDASGKAVKGVLESDSLRSARQRLREQHLTPSQIIPQKKSLVASLLAARHRPRFSSSELALVTRQLATLIAASLPLEEALLTVAHQSEKKTVIQLITRLRSHVLEGLSLSQALMQFPSVFDRLFCAMVAAGESSGQLPLIFTELADYVEQRQKIKNKMTQAMTYPVILTLVAIAVISLLLVAVVPKVIEQFVHMKQTLPLTTQILLICSDGISRWGPVALAIMGAAMAVFRWQLRKARFRLAWHRYLLRMPALGPLFLNLDTARYAHTLSILTLSAVPLLDSMNISAAVLNNDEARSRLLAAMTQVQEGGSLQQALTETALFSPMMRHMIAAGERSSELGSMLKRAADMQQDALNQRIALVLSLFEPALVISMAGIVLFIILAILQPILQLNNMMG
jgi:general secretion pathway protein F